MIIYTRETKTLVIPEGLGDNTGNEGYNEGFLAGKAAQKAIDDAAITPTTTITENGSYTADYGFKNVVVNVDGGECNLQGKTYDLDGYFTGTAIVHPDNGYDGMTQVVVRDNGYGGACFDNGAAAQKAEDDSNITPTLNVTTNGTYEAEYGYGQVVVNVPQSGDCSEAYDQGYAAAIGEVSSIFIRVGYASSISSMPHMAERDIEINGNSYTITNGYNLVPGGRVVDLAYNGTLGVKYITPSTVSVTVRTTDIQSWEANWEIREIRFNGSVDIQRSSYTGGFKASIASWAVTTVDEYVSKITITLN